MALEQKLHLRLAQKLVMTPTLQQAIKLLQLSRLELEQALAHEVQANPLLEMSEEAPPEDEGGASDATAEGDEGAASEQAGIAEEAAAAEEKAEPAVGEGPALEEPAPAEGAVAADASFTEVELDSLFANYLHDAPSVTPAWDESEERSLENAPSPAVSMFDDLCEQLHLLAVEPEIARVCEFIIGNLDPDGYLRTADEDIAAQLGIDPERVREAVAVVQRLDPAGIGARTLQECFLLQLERRPLGVDPELIARTKRVVSEGFDDLLHQRWDFLAHKFSVSRDAIRGVLEVLRHLDSRPGVQLGPTTNPAIEPDVVVTKDGEKWRVTLNDDGLPRLRISPRYLRLLQNRSLEGEAKGYLRERMRSALWFLRSVEQRQSTIVRVATAIVGRQQGFLEAGLSGLRPLVLRDIADDIGMHESTVSRVVTNKYMTTPRGIFPLKFFFHSAISHALQGDISSVVVKERIRELIEQEDPDHPLSDARVARQLNRLGIRIARRTVAKYREELRVPSSEQRRRALR
jgi:RNA polymerase sigma-54 factor